MNTSEEYRKHHILQPHHGLDLSADMDYSSYFAPPVAQQSYNFMDLPPTPAHTQAVGNGEFSDESPPAGFDFQFDAYGNFNPNGLQPQPPTPQSQHSQQGTSMPSVKNGNESLDADSGEQKGSNSDGDEEATPALSRRKAQNRAAQRAFRERKERHVKELEAQVAALKAASTSSASENEALKLHLQKLATENEILKATSTHHSSSRSLTSLPDTGPMVYKPADYNPSAFYQEVLQKHENKTPSHRIVLAQDGSGGRLLAAGATWDYIIAHPLFKKGLVDVSAVSERLKSRAKCDGQGPVFEERAIEEAIESSVASGSDELM